MEIAFLHARKSLFLHQSGRSQLIFPSAVNEQKQIPWASSGAKAAQLFKIPCGCRGLSSSLYMANRKDMGLYSASDFISYFSHCCDKTAKINLRKKGLISSQFEATAHHGRGLRAREREKHRYAVLISFLFT